MIEIRSLIRDLGKSHTHSDLRDSCHLNVTSGNRRPYGRNH